MRISDWSSDVCSSDLVKASAPGRGRLPGGKFTFPVVSVGATENALMAAVLAKGTCVLENAAREPEIVDLCNCLVAMGAHIDGIGNETLTIEGVDRLHGANRSETRRQGKDCVSQCKSGWSPHH